MQHTCNIHACLAGSCPSTRRPRQWNCRPWCHCGMILTLLLVTMLIWWVTPWEDYVALAYLAEDGIDDINNGECYAEGQRLPCRGWNPNVPASRVTEEVDRSGTSSPPRDLKLLKEIIAPRRSSCDELRGALARWKEG